MVSESRELIAELKSAFAQRSKPGQVGVVSSHEYPREEGALVQDFFSRVTVDELTLTSLEAGDLSVWRAVASFMTVEGLAYFLPALLGLCLDHYDDCDYLVDDIWGLLTGDEQERGAALASILTLDEKKAVQAFLRRFLAVHRGDFSDADGDLARGLARFCN